MPLVACVNPRLKTTPGREPVKSCWSILSGWSGWQPPEQRRHVTKRGRHAQAPARCLSLPIDQDGQHTGVFASPIIGFGIVADERAFRWGNLQVTRGELEGAAIGFPQSRLFADEHGPEMG